jgi:hypothetical protein
MPFPMTVGTYQIAFAYLPFDLLYREPSRRCFGYREIFVLAITMMKVQTSKIRFSTYRTRQTSFHGMDQRASFYFLPFDVLSMNLLVLLVPIPQVLFHAVLTPTLQVLSLFRERRLMEFSVALRTSPHQMSS